jgi:hypothetical protein
MHCEKERAVDCDPGDCHEKEDVMAMPQDECDYVQAKDMRPHLSANLQLLRLATELESEARMLRKLHEALPIKLPFVADAALRKLVESHRRVRDLHLS